MDPERTDRRRKDSHDAIYLTRSNYLTDVSKTISLDDDIGKMLMWYQFQDTYVVLAINTCIAVLTSWSVDPLKSTQRQSISLDSIQNIK